MNTIEYFKSNDYQVARLILEGCPMLKGIPDAVPDILAASSIEEANKDTKIIEQNDTSKDLFILLEGEVDVLINNRGVVRRKPPNHIGEMSVVDVIARRSATVLSLERIVFLRINHTAFIPIANKYPRIWQNISVELAERLRQRGEKVDEKKAIPVLFIGSSAEYLNIAHAIQTGMVHDDISVNVWSDDVFRPSVDSLTALEEQAERCDFALFLFGPDDVVISRETESQSPRDNVVFELGLFMGCLTSNRVFFAKEIGKDIKIPSDLFGITPIEYKRKQGESIDVSVQPICHELRKMVSLLGVR